MKRIGLMDVKEALKDARFRDTLPHDLRPEVVKFLDNPGCACNVGLYRKLLRDCRKQLSDYFPGAEITDEAKEVESLAKNNFVVINCHINELELRLRKLPPGRKQLELARYQDQVTAVVNELDILY